MRILLVVNHNSDPLVVSAYVADCFSHSDLEVDVLNVLPSAEGNVAGVVQGQGGNVVYYFRLTHPSRHNHQNAHGSKPGAELRFLTPIFEGSAR